MSDHGLFFIESAGAQMKFLLILLVYSGLALASGRTVGNGGDVVFCQGKEGQQSFELLDFYEGRVLRGLKMDLGGSELSVEEKIDKALIRLSRVSPKRAAQYRHQAFTFFSESLFLSDVGLVDVPDSGHIVLPKNCQILQIANQSEPLYPEDRRYVIDKDIWDQLDSDNKVGLILHEIVYREAIAIGHINSISTRLLNSNMTSLRIESMNVQQYTEFLQDLGFTTNTVQGIDVVLNDPQKVNPVFSPHGILLFASVSSAAALDWEGQNLRLRDSVEFYDSGALKKAFLLGIQTVSWLQQEVSLGPYEMSFFPDGKLRALTVDKPVRWASRWVDLVLRSSLRWSSTGNFFQGQVVKGRVWLRDQWVEIKNLAVFHELGMAKEVEFVTPQLMMWNGQRLEWRGRIELNPHGDVINGFLNDTTTEIFTHGSKVSFKAYYPVSFFEDGHEVKSGCLGRTLFIPREWGGPVKYGPGQIIHWDEHGQVRVDENKSC